MIPFLVASLAALAVGAVYVASHWSDIIDWLYDFLPKLKRFWDSQKIYLPHAAMMVGDRIIEGATQLVRIMHKQYYREQDGQWVVKTTTTKVDESQVPDYILAKVNMSGQETNITEEMQNELGMEI